MSKISDAELKALSEGELRESLGRSRGTLLFKKAGTTTTGYYCYLHQRKRRLVKLGTYRSGRTKTSGFSLQELRDKALDLSRTRQEIAPADLKEHLEELEQERQREQQRRRQKKLLEASFGTLDDLFDSYVLSLKRREAHTSRQVESMYQCYCQKPFPHLGRMKARDITPDDIVLIIRRMIQKGITSTSNRMRSFLHAAFAHGLKSDHDPRQLVEHGKRFNLSFNPVSAVPRQADFERVRERRLDDDEIKRMWKDVDKGKPKASPLYGLLLRFCLACYGNRPEQLARITWEDIDYRQRTLTFIDRKGKNARPKKRVIPLSKIALEILEKVQVIADERKLCYDDTDKKCQWPFSITGKSPISIPNLSHFVQAYNFWLKEQGFVDEDYETWTAKDLRTTGTSLLVRLRIYKEQRYLLQSREDGSIESKHYDHDDRLSEKREAARVYTEELERIIEGREAETLVDMEEYRQNLKF